jgi:hypothetical protein
MRGRRAVSEGCEWLIERGIALIRTVLQSAHFFILCPLLMAQQAPTINVNSDRTQSPVPALATDAPQQIPAFVTIPKDTEIKIIALEAISSATAVVGAPVKFAVAEDVVADGIIVVHAGTPVNGTIVQVTRGSQEKHRVGHMTIRFAGMDLGNHLNLQVTGTYPGNRKTSGRVFKSVAEGALDSIAFVAVLPFAIAYTIATSDGEKPAGNEARLPLCFPKVVFVVPRQKVPTNGLAEVPAEAKTALQGACFASGESRPIIDWTGADWEQLEMR